SRPMNGAEYLESLRDGRQIYIHGEKVDDVTTHPAFRNSARMIARLFDALHSDEHKAALTTETDTGNGGYTHAFFKAPHSAARPGAGRGPPPRLAGANLGRQGPRPRLQGRVSPPLRPERRLLRAVGRQRSPLVQGGAGARLVHEPPAGHPAGRPRQADPRRA